MATIIPGTEFYTMILLSASQCTFYTKYSTLFVSCRPTTNRERPRSPVKGKTEDTQLTENQTHKSHVFSSRRNHVVHAPGGGKHWHSQPFPLYTRDSNKKRSSHRGSYPSSQPREVRNDGFRQDDELKFFDFPNIFVWNFDRQ